MHIYFTKLHRAQSRTANKELSWAAALYQPPPGDPLLALPTGPAWGISNLGEEKDKTTQILQEPHYSNSSRSSKRTAVTLGEAQSYLQGE